MDAFMSETRSKLKAVEELAAGQQHLNLAPVEMQRISTGEASAQGVDP